MTSFARLQFRLGAQPGSPAGLVVFARDESGRWPASRTLDPVAHSTQRRERFGRFVVVSAATVVTGHLILYWLHSVAGMAPVPANLASTVANTGIVLIANRRWVWQVENEVGFRREVAPFLAIAAVGLAVSTAVVWLVSETIGEGLWVNAANLVGFGVVWLGRFLVLDRYVYPPSRAE